MATLFLAGAYTGTFDADDPADSSAPAGSEGPGDAATAPDDSDDNADDTDGNSDDVGGDSDGPGDDGDGQDGGDDDRDGADERSDDGSGDDGPVFPGGGSGDSDSSDSSGDSESTDDSDDDAGPADQLSLRAACNGEWVVENEADVLVQYRFNATSQAVAQPRFAPPKGADRFAATVGGSVAVSVNGTQVASAENASGACPERSVDLESTVDDIREEPVLYPVAGSVDGYSDAEVAEENATVTVQHLGDDGDRYTGTLPVESAENDSADGTFSGYVRLQPEPALVRVSVDNRSDVVALDGDGVSATFERTELGSDPLDPDSDFAVTDANESVDGRVDGAEVLSGGPSVGVQERLGMDPHVNDTSGDGLSDAFEARDLAMLHEGIDGNVSEMDLSGDGLTVAEEHEHGTDPFDPDTAGDGLTDAYKVERGWDPTIESQSDDGLTDYEELLVGSDPEVVDSDGDGVADGNESVVVTEANRSVGAAVQRTTTADDALTFARSVYVTRERNHTVFDEVEENVSAFVSVQTAGSVVRGTNQTADVVLDYDTDAVEDPENVTVYRYEPHTGDFSPLPTTVHPETGTVVGETEHFSNFVALDDSQFDDIEEVNHDLELTDEADLSGDGLSNLETVQQMDDGCPDPATADSDNDGVPDGEDDDPCDPIPYETDQYVNGEFVPPVTPGDEEQLRIHDPSENETRFVSLAGANASTSGLDEEVTYETVDVEVGASEEDRERIQTYVDDPPPDVSTTYVPVNGQPQNPIQNGQAFLQGFVIPEDRLPDSRTESAAYRLGAWIEDKTVQRYTGGFVGLRDAADAGFHVAEDEPVEAVDTMVDERALVEYLLTRGVDSEQLDAQLETQDAVECMEGIAESHSGFVDTDEGPNENVHTDPEIQREAADLVGSVCDNVDTIKTITETAYEHRDVIELEFDEPVYPGETRVALALERDVVEIGDHEIEIVVDSPFSRPEIEDLPEREPIETIDISVPDFEYTICRTCGGSTGGFGGGGSGSDDTHTGPSGPNFNVAFGGSGSTGSLVQEETYEEATLRVNAGSDLTANPNQTLSFEPEIVQGGSPVVLVDWSFGDGTAATGRTASHAYEEPGRYTLRLVAHDSAGNVASDSTTVTVRGRDAEVLEDTATLQDEVSAADPGTVLEVPAGEYHDLEIDTPGLTLVGDDDVEFTTLAITAPNVTVEGPTIDGGLSAEAPHATVYDATITAADDWAAAVSADDVTLRDNEIRGPNGLHVAPALQGVLVAENVLVAEAEYGVRVGATGDDVFVQNNYVESETVGIYRGHATDGVIERNTIVAPTERQIVENDPPALEWAVSDDAPVAGDLVDVAASGTVDPNGDDFDYGWDVSGDGDADVVDEALRFRVADPGNRTVTLIAVDEHGARSEAEIPLTVAPATDPDASIEVVGQNQNEVGFSALSTTDPAIRDLTYTWAFGDGTSVETDRASVTHEYPQRDDSYEVTLTVEDAHAGTDVATRTVNVTMNRAPVADAGGDRTVEVGDRVTFDATNSTDPTGDDGELSYRWTFHDGERVLDPVTERTYTEIGTVSVRLDVQDRYGLADTAEIEVNVTPRDVPFSTEIDGQDALDQGETGSYAASVEGVDPATIERYEWEFPDGSIANGTEATHAFATAGERDVVLRATTEDGATAVDALTVDVRPTERTVGENDSLQAAIDESRPGDTVLVDADVDAAVVVDTPDVAITGTNGTAPTVTSLRIAAGDVSVSDLDVREGVTVADATGVRVAESAVASDGHAVRLAGGSSATLANLTVDATDRLVDVSEDAAVSFEGTTTVENGSHVVAAASLASSPSERLTLAPSAVRNDAAGFELQVPAEYYDQHRVGVPSAATLYGSPDVTLRGLDLQAPNATVVAVAVNASDGWGVRVEADDATVVDATVRAEDGILLEEDVAGTRLLNATVTADGTGVRAAPGATAAAEDAYVAAEAGFVLEAGSAGTIADSAVDATETSIDRTSDGWTVENVSILNTPEAAIDAPETALLLDDDAQFSAANSAVDESADVTYRWKMGDGTTRTGETIEHAYADRGDHTVTLEVVEDGDVDVATLNVSVHVPGNLVGYWTFDETGGDTIHDQSGNENHGQIYGGVDLGAEGHRNGTSSYRFDGQSGYVTVPDVEGYEGDEFSFAAWVNVETTSRSSIMDMHDYADLGDDGEGKIHIEQGNGDYFRATLKDDSGNGVIDMQDARPMPTHEWVFLVVRYDGTEAEMSFNGRVVDTDTGSADIASTEDFQFGMHKQGRWFDGRMSEIRIYNEYLTDAQLENVREGHDRIDGDDADD